MAMQNKISVRSDLSLLCKIIIYYYFPQYSLLNHYFSGQIISVETVRCRDLDPDNIYVTGHVKPNNCFWKEYPDTKKRFALCIRVYALFGQGMEGYESIGKHRMDGSMAD